MFFVVVIEDSLICVQCLCRMKVWKRLFSLILILLCCSLECSVAVLLRRSNDLSPLSERSFSSVSSSSTFSSIFHVCAHDRLFSSHIITDYPVTFVQFTVPVNAALEKELFSASFSHDTLGKPNVPSNSYSYTSATAEQKENLTSSNEENKIPVMRDGVVNGISLSEDEWTFPIVSTINTTVNGRNGENENTSASDMNESKSCLSRPLKFRVFFVWSTSCRKVGELVPSTVQETNENTIYCTEEDILTAKKELLVRKVVQEATRRLSLSLLSIPVQAITVPSDVCDGLLMWPASQSSSERFSTAINSSSTNFSSSTVVEDADFVLFVSASPLLQADQTIAWGKPCVRENVTTAGRPVIGQINFIPSRINVEGRVVEQLIVTTMHEISHALGFINLFGTLSSYVDLSGERHASGGTVKVYRPGLQKEVQLVQTPRVVQAAREHFGCPTLDGVEIEDMGGAGTAGSHWKKRLFYQEALVGVVSSASLFYSSLTLSFFEDAGFYKARYSYAEDNYRWGYHRGCEFATQNCHFLWEKGIADEFCFSTSSSSQCTYDKHSVGACDTMSYQNPLPEEYQYFPDDPNRGGSMSTMDYCPTVVYYDNVDCVDPYNVPLINIYGNEFGSSSRCFESTVITHSLPQLGRHPHCFRTSCVPSSVPYPTTATEVEEKVNHTPHFSSSLSSSSLPLQQQIILHIQGQTIPCPINGSEGYADTTGLRGLHGSVSCPSAIDICPFLRTTHIFHFSSPVAWENSSTNSTPHSACSTAASSNESRNKAAEGLPPPSFFLTRWWSTGVEVLRSSVFLTCSQKVDECLAPYLLEPEECKQNKNRKYCKAILCGPFVNRAKDCVPIQCFSALKHWVANRFALPIQQNSHACWSEAKEIAEHCIDGWRGANALCHLMELE